MEYNQDAYFIELVERYMNNTCSKAELNEVLTLAEKEPHKLYNALKEQWSKVQHGQENSQLSVNTIIEQAREIEDLVKPGKEDETATSAFRFSRQRNRRRWIGIAAAAVFIIGITAYFFSNKPGNQPQVRELADVVAPASNKATVRLANGQTITLDSLQSGTIAVQEDGRLIKNKNGELVYQAEATVSDHTPVYNTLDNPRGSKVVDMTLADGTHIWLNAGSSITFPVAFTGNERKLELKGEAYLEVSHNAAKPFIVQTGDLSIEVLGTGFNVNAYHGSEPVKVTLLKGSVKLLANGTHRLLKPGQQASVKEQIRVNNNIDIDDVMAWKNNKFIFDKSDIQQIMHQLEQWYDIEVVYEGTPTREAFMGSISREVNLSQILSLLSETNAVHFEQRGKKVIVKR